jgi:hypothetical protein
MTNLEPKIFVLAVEPYRQVVKSIHYVIIKIFFIKFIEYFLFLIKNKVPKFVL